MSIIVAYFWYNVPKIHEHEKYASTSSNTVPWNKKMETLTKIPVKPLQRIVTHWLELCSGVMNAGLSTILANGIITIQSVSLVEKDRIARLLLATRLVTLHKRCPKLLSEEAIKRPFTIQQDVAKLKANDFQKLSKIDVIFATPPCRPFFFSKTYIWMEFSRIITFYIRSQHNQRDIWYT